MTECKVCGSSLCNYTQAEAALELAAAAFKPYEDLPHVARFSGDAKAYFDEWSEAQQVYTWARINCRNRFLAAKVVQHGEDCAADREPSCDPPPGPCNCRLSA